MDCSTRGFPVLHYLLEFAQLELDYVVAAGSTVEFTVGGLLPGAQMAMKTFWSLSGQDYFQDLGHWGWC